MINTTPKASAASQILTAAKENPNKVRTKSVESVEEYLARGGKITSVPAGVIAHNPALAHCRCGCLGNRDVHLLMAGAHANKAFRGA